MTLDGYKEVYDTRDLTDLRPLYWTNEKLVLHPYTTVKPPEGENIILKGFDFNNQKWQYDETVNKDSYKYLSTVVANLMKENMDLKSRVTALENPVIDEPTEEIIPESTEEGVNEDVSK